MTSDPAVGIDQGPGAVSEVEQRAKRIAESCYGSDYAEVLSDLLALVADLRQQQEQLQARLGTWDDCKAQSDAVDRANARAEAAEASLTAKDAEIQRLNDLQQRTMADACRELDKRDQQLTALRREQEQLVPCKHCGKDCATGVCEHCAWDLKVAAEATGEAAVSELNEWRRRFGLRTSAGWQTAAEAEAAQQAIYAESGKRLQDARQQLADRSAAIAQIVQEMEREAKTDTEDGNDSAAATTQVWIERLRGVVRC